jgi:hypothetical protein
MSDVERGRDAAAPSMASGRGGRGEKTGPPGKPRPAAHRPAPGGGAHTRSGQGQLDGVRRHQRNVFAAFGGNVLGKLQVHGTRTLLLRDPKGFPDERRYHPRRDDLARQLGQRLHGRDDIHDLKARLPRGENSLLAGNHDYGHGTEKGVRRTGREIQRARPQGGDAHAGLAGEPAIGGGHEGRGLFMARQHQLDGGIADRLDDVEILLAGNTVDSLDALVLKRRHQQGRSFDHRHRLCRPTGVRFALHRIYNGRRIGATAQEARK